MLECNQSAISRMIFIRDSNMKFHVKSTSGSLVDTCRWTDGSTNGRTDISKLIGGFAGYGKTPVSHTSFFLLFASFHELSTNLFKLITNFLSQVTTSGKFPSLRRGIGWMYTHAYRSLDCEFMIRCLEMFFLYFVNTFINS